jgi:hypothetical protein
MQTKMTGLLLPILWFSFAALAIAKGPWHASETNTRGWQLMTPEERIEHQSRIRGFTSLAECRAYQLWHHQRMEERAKQRGKALPTRRRDICEHLSPKKDSPQQID